LRHAGPRNEGLTMQAAQVVALANALDPARDGSMLAFAHMLAEHCAQVAEECPDGATAVDAAAAIRTAFRLIGAD
jgi:hypothetical protein